MEIERKYLVDLEKLASFLPEFGKEIRQGYFISNDKFAVRVRTKGEKGFLTIKGSGNGLSRPEYEYEIPFMEAVEMLNAFTKPYLHKIRYEIVYENKLWEIDVFQDELSPLILAEIELNTEDESFRIPPFITEEVTFDPSYLNANIIKRLKK